MSEDLESESASDSAGKFLKVRGEIHDAKSHGQSFDRFCVLRCTRTSLGRHNNSIQFAKDMHEGNTARSGEPT
jgi:hypothetical protein